MKKSNKKIIYMVFILLVTSSCKTLNTNLNIRENKIPTSFNTTIQATSIAKINWHQYFDDTLLTQLIDSALVNNFDYQSALQRIEMARAGAVLAKGEILPKVSGNASLGSTRYGKYTESGQGNITTPYPDDPSRNIPNPVSDYNIALTTTWEIDIWGKLQNQRKAAISNYLASIEGKNFIVSNLVAEIAIAYYELIALDNELEILKQSIQKQQEALEVVKFQKETGKSNQLAVQQFQAQLLNSKVLEKETLQNITETENKINFLLGRYPQPIQRNKDILSNKIPEQVATGIPSQLLSNRPDIRQAEFQVAASKFDFKVAKASFFPNVNLSTALGFQSFNPQFFLVPSSIGYSALGGLVAPLINMNALKAQFNTAKANQLSAMYNYQKMILNGYIEVVNEISNIQRLQEIGTIKIEQNDVLSESVETSIELHKTARASYLEVLIAQQNSLQTKLELINTNKLQRISTVNLYKALGGGW